MQRVYSEHGPVSPPRPSIAPAATFGGRAGQGGVATSRLTVRLPDLTAPPPSLAARQRENDDLGSFAEEPQSEQELREHDAAERTTAATALARVYQFVGQPKFWLACITAIGVQVVLALVFTPAAPPNAAPRVVRKASAEAPQRAGAARIVVPPAETPAAAAATTVPGADELAAPRMQPAPPVDTETRWEPLPPASADPSDGAAATGTGARGDARPGPRLAEQKRLAGEQTYDGRTAQESLGATLEGVMPIDDVELEQPNRGSR